MTATNSEELSDLFGVKIVPSRALSEGEILVVSRPRMTHAENLTTGEQQKILDFIDAIKVKNLARPKATPTIKQEEK